jgi:hypothetical protein
MKAIDSNRTFGNPDREWAALCIRAHVRELLEQDEKDYDAIKLIYGIILEEEQQDLTRRKVELAERQDEREANADKKPEQKSLPPVEIKRRVRIALGKETQ